MQSNLSCVPCTLWISCQSARQETDSQRVVWLALPGVRPVRWRLGRWSWWLNKETAPAAPPPFSPSPPPSLPLRTIQTNRNRKWCREEFDLTRAIPLAGSDEESNGMQRQARKWERIENTHNKLWQGILFGCVWLHMCVWWCLPFLFIEYSSRVGECCLSCSVVTYYMMDLGNVCIITC